MQSLVACAYCKLALDAKSSAWPREPRPGPKPAEISQFLVILMSLQTCQKKHIQYEGSWVMLRVLASNIFRVCIMLALSTDFNVQLWYNHYKRQGSWVGMNYEHKLIYYFNISLSLCFSHHIIVLAVSEKQDGFSPSFKGCSSEQILY